MKGIKMMHNTLMHFNKRLERGVGLIAVLLSLTACDPLMMFYLANASISFPSDKRVVSIYSDISNTELFERLDRKIHKIVSDEDSQQSVCSSEECFSLAQAHYETCFEDEQLDGRLKLSVLANEPEHGVYKVHYGAKVCFTDMMSGGRFGIDAEFYRRSEGDVTIILRDEVSRAAMPLESEMDYLVSILNEVVAEYKAASSH